MTKGVPMTTEQTARMEVGQRLRRQREASGLATEADRIAAAVMEALSKAQDLCRTIASRVTSKLGEDAAMQCVHAIAALASAPGEPKMTACLNAIASNEPCKPDDTFKRKSDTLGERPSTNLARQIDLAMLEFGASSMLSIVKANPDFSPSPLSLFVADRIALASAPGEPRTAPDSCPLCHDESDCGNVEICQAVAAVYAPGEPKCECCEGSGKAFNAIDMEWSVCLYCGGTGKPRHTLAPASLDPRDAEIGRLKEVATEFLSAFEAAYSFKPLPHGQSTMKIPSDESIRFDKAKAALRAALAPPQQEKGE